MAFAQDRLFLFIYRTAVDDFKHKHVIRIRGALSDAGAFDAFRFRHANPDAKVESMREIPDDTVTADETARIIKEGGPNYRPIQQGEENLTIEAVAKLRGKAFKLPGSPSASEGPSELSEADRASEEGQSRVRAIIAPELSLP